MVLGTLVLEVAATTLFVAGQGTLAVVYAILVLANAALMIILGQ